MKTRGTQWLNRLASKMEEIEVVLQ